MTAKAKPPWTEANARCCGTDRPGQAAASCPTRSPRKTLPPWFVAKPTVFVQKPHICSPTYSKRSDERHMQLMKLMSVGVVHSQPSLFCPPSLQIGGGGDVNLTSAISSCLLWRQEALKRPNWARSLANKALERVPREHVKWEALPPH